MDSKHRFVHKRSASRRFGSGLLHFLIGSAICVLLAGTQVQAASSTIADAPSALPSVQLEPTAVQVTLSAADTSASWDSRHPEAGLFDLPVLYLNHNGQAGAEVERALTVSISGFTGGMPVEVEIVSWHVNRATWEHHRQVARFRLPDRACTAQDPCVLRWALDAETLSDYYRLTVRDDGGQVLWENPEPERPDLVALDTWEVELDGYTVRVTYARLFPFARGERNLYHRLTPDAVDDFVAEQFLPIVVETWQTQFHAWGFGPIHPDWDADGVVEIYLTCPPFALSGGTGTYTASTYRDGSPYPERRIWLLASDNTLQTYDALEHGYKVLLSHEFYHMAQWNVLLSTGCPVRRWGNVFLEAQARVASAVQYPELELSREHLVAPNSEYGSAASRYLEQRLETSYAELEAEQDHLYDAALYWRFLYEQSGSMDLLRVALEEMACRPVDDIPGTLDEVMDATLARMHGPLKTFEESLVAFARANYALRPYSRGPRSVWREVP